MNTDDDIEIRFPTNVVTTTTRFRWTETELDDDALTIAPGPFGGVTFLLKALTGDDIADDFAFANPVYITITYTNAEVGLIDEDDLMLYFRDTDQNRWRPVTETCDDDVDEPILRDPANNQLSVAVCHLTQFALFGEFNTRLLLPLIQK